MKFTRHKRYWVSWLDITSQSKWADDKAVAELLRSAGKPIRQQLYYISSDKLFHAFTNTLTHGDEPYFDTIVIPKGAITKIT